MAAQKLGQTVSMAAVATHLSIEHNYKILMINTKQHDTTLEDAYWDQNKSPVVKIAKDKTDIGSGMTALMKAIASNKTSPEIITNYTKIIFKNRLELLTDKKIIDEDYAREKKLMKELIKMANKYYDLVFVDLEGNIEDDYIKEILELSNLNILTVTQKLRNINDFIKLKTENSIMQKDNNLIIIGRYDGRTTYNQKNLSRLSKELKDNYVIPYNTQYFEACSEGKVADYFIKFRKISATNVNALFVSSVKKLSEKIVTRLKELQMKIY